MDTKTKLVYMANQIGDFFKSYPHDQAVKGIAEHIKKFWDPRMLKQIYEIVEQPDPGLKPLVLEAIQDLAGKAKQPAA
ncbi:MAG TPA: formate dehydrogenase subunit delta [Dongiaceae bacterium]|nr:formate dehydrogenase subunit delta [Dongiaceae bacterium]